MAEANECCIFKNVSDISSTHEKNPKNRTQTHESLVLPSHVTQYYKRLRDPETWVLLSFTRENEPVEFGSGFCSPAYELILRENLGAFKKCLKNGAYADAKVQSCKQANTLMHEVVLRDKALWVEALIKCGASREILNHDNETPLELAIRLKKKKCIKMFKKYEKKMFKIILPEPFSKHNYTIEVDRDIPDEEHYNADFFKKYRQHVPQTGKRPSHYVVKTDKKNVFHVSERHLPMIFNASMFMGHRWLKACLDDSSKIGNNKEFRVTKMKFRGVEYETVLEIKDFVNRMNVPYMYGIGLSYNMPHDIPQWKLMRKIVTQLGVFDGTGDFPSMTYKLGTSYHRDDYPRNFFLYRPNERTQVELNYKSTWIDKPEFAFLNTDEFIHFLLEFKIDSSRIKEVEKKNKKPGLPKKVGKNNKGKEQQKKKKKEESNTSNSAPENSDSGPSTLTKTVTPVSNTPTSVTQNSRTPISRTPGTTRR